MKLSAGVQQQIGVARALVSDPFILIVDEATASLDPETADTVNRAILELMRGHTTILIVSRVLMARAADQVAVMDNGQIVESGDHDSLLREHDSLYRELFVKQYGEERLPPVQEA